MKLLKNYVYQLIFQLLNIITPLLTLPYITRVLGAENLGEYTYSLSIITYILMFADLGIKIYGNRKIAYLRDNEEEKSKVFWELFYQKFILSFLIFIGTILFFKIKEYKVLYLLQSVTILSNIFDISWFFQGIEDFKKITLRNFLSKILLLFSIFIFIKKPEDIILYALLTVGINFLSNLTLWISLKKHINFKNIFEVKSFKNIKESFQLFLPQIAISIYTLLDKIMIGYLSDKENVSFYDISNKLVILSMILITTTGGVFLPRISNLYSNKKFDEIKEMVYKTSGIFSVISLPLIFGIIAVSDNLIKLLLPIEYFPVACSLKIMAITIIFWTYNNITGSQLLIPMGMENKLTISVVVGAVVNVVLNYFLIKQQGALGATIATVITEGIVTSIQIYYVRDFFRIRVSSFVKAFIGSLGMYILIAPLNNLFYQIGLGVGIYFIILIILKENVLFENINLVRDILKKRQLKFQK